MSSLWSCFKGFCRRTVKNKHNGNVIPSNKNNNSGNNNSGNNSEAAHKRNVDNIEAERLAKIMDIEGAILDKDREFVRTLGEGKTPGDYALERLLNIIRVILENKYTTNFVKNKEELLVKLKANVDKYIDRLYALKHYCNTHKSYRTFIPDLLLSNPPNIHAYVNIINVIFNDSLWTGCNPTTDTPIQTYKCATRAGETLFGGPPPREGGRRQTHKKRHTKRRGTHKRRSN